MEKNILKKFENNFLDQIIQQDKLLSYLKIQRNWTLTVEHLQLIFKNQKLNDLSLTHILGNYYRNMQRNDCTFFLSLNLIIFKPPPKTNIGCIWLQTNPKYLTTYVSLSILVVLF